MRNILTFQGHVHSAGSLPLVNVWHRSNQNQGVFLEISALSLEGKKELALGAEQPDSILVLISQVS